MRTTLTEKERRFVDAYLGEAYGNASEAARIAGYRGNRVTLASVGYEVVHRPAVRAEIDRRYAEDTARRHAAALAERAALYEAQKAAERARQAKYRAARLAGNLRKPNKT